MALPVGALNTAPTHDVGLAGYVVANRSVADVGRGFYDGAAELMTDDARRLDTGGSPGIPVIDVEVGSADRGCFKLDLYGSGEDLRFGHVDNVNPRGGTHLRDRFHRGEF